VNARNVRQAAPSTFVTTNTWATLTGGQRDDDHDGFGNKCDGDFTPTGINVGSGDTAQYIPSLTKSRSALTGCGSAAGERCSRYDLDEAGVAIGSGDTTVYATVAAPATPLLGRAKGPKCPACPLACVVGSAVPGGCSSVP
jgi:hypothetical protein